MLCNYTERKKNTNCLNININAQYVPRTGSNTDVLKTAVKLKNKSSHGHDGISTKLLKESISIIINPITLIINRSFDTGIVPHEMKMAKVVPIYKASDKSLLKNYRPVSLLPPAIFSSNANTGFDPDTPLFTRLSTFSIIVLNLQIKLTRNYTGHPM